MGWTTDANGKLVYTPDAGPTKAPDTTGQVAMGPDGQWHYLTYVNGKEVLGTAIAPSPPTPNKPLTYEEQLALAQAPRTSSSNNTSNSTSTSTSTTTNTTPQVYQASDGSTHVYDPVTATDRVIAAAGGMTPYQAAQLQNAYDIAAMQGRNSTANTATSEAGANSRNTATIAGSAANTQAQIAGQAANTAATEAGANARQLGQQTFTGAENAQNLSAADTNQARTIGASAIDAQLARAAQAGQFAADYGLKVAQQQMADRQAALGAAKTFSDLSGSADLTGYDRFLAAGGGSIGGAIQRGATSLTPQGQLGAARALQVAQQPLPTYAAYTPPTESNPYARYIGPVTYQNVAPPPPALIGAPVAAAPGAAAPVAAAPAGGGGIAGFFNNLGAGPTPGTIAGDASAAAGYTGGPTSGFALGTGHRPIRRQLGLVTNGRVSEPVATAPSGAGIGDVTGRFAAGTRYATGTFETGDSTDPQDPAAGGAHPELVHLEDPPGANNARATVTPETTPGVGPTAPLTGDVLPPGADDTQDDTDEQDSDPMALTGALLVAIGRFMAGMHEASEAPPQGPQLGGGDRYALGTLLRRGFPKHYARYAEGIGPNDPSGAVQPEDQPYIDQVMQMRKSTPYSVNPYDAGYLTSQLPTQRAIGQAAYQVATGAPGADLSATAAYYQPNGLDRNSPYRSLQLGM